MSLFVIRREDGKYLTQHQIGNEAHCWTTKLQYAWFFGTRAAAECELCPENEYVQEVTEHGRRN